jgi:hypothetical protein
LRLESARLAALGSFSSALLSPLAGHFSPITAAVAEEIRGAELAPPGHFKLEQRFGYTTTFNPRMGDTPAGQASQAAGTGETEISYGLTEWWDIAVTTPYAIARRDIPLTPVNMDAVPGYALQTGGVTIRQIFLQPDREERDVYFGVLVRGGYAPPGSFASDLFIRVKQPILGTTTFAMEATPRVFGQVSPIVGWRFGGDYQLLFNANFNFAVGSPGSAFEPNVRVIKHIDRKLAVGFEYFSNLGPIGRLVPWRQQQHRLFAVAKTKFWGVEWGVGLGYGFTAASRGFAANLSLEKAF